MSIDYEKAYEDLVAVLAEMRREVMKHKANRENATRQAEQIKELSDLIIAVEKAATDDAGRYYFDE